MLQRQAAPLREQAVRELRERIVLGKYSAGMRLKEAALVNELQVSRTVIREALRQLESEKLVWIKPQVGPVVAELTVDQARQLYEVRSALEASAARLAAAHRTDEQLYRLQESLGTIEENFTPVESLIDAKRGFYEALIEASHNAIIGEQLQGVQARISLLRRVTLSHPGRGPHMLEELHAVVDAVAAGDEERAFAASIKHVMTASSIAMEHLTELTEAQ